MLLSMGEGSRDTETIAQETEGGDGTKPGQLPACTIDLGSALENGEKIYMHARNPSA